MCTLTTMCATADAVVATNKTRQPRELACAMARAVAVEGIPLSAGYRRALRRHAHKICAMRKLLATTPDQATPT